MALMLILRVHLPAILAFLSVTLPQSNALISTHTTSSSCSERNSFACDLEAANLRVTRLETLFEERIGEVNARSQYITECENKVQDLSVDIDRLKTALSSFEHDYSHANLKLSALEEEVRLLWAASRKNNFEIHALEYKALDAERRLKEVTSQVDEMAEIVSEQWIQIQQLEQAVHMAEIRTSKVRKELWRRCPVVKFFINSLETLKDILDPYIPMDDSFLVYCKSQALGMFEAAKHYHHQGFIEHAMKSNELTTALAHEEVVFFVASALVAFPIMTACMLLLSQFS